MISKMGIMDIGTSFILNGMSLSLRNEPYKHIRRNRMPFYEDAVVGS